MATIAKKKAPLMKATSQKKTPLMKAAKAQKPKSDQVALLQQIVTLLIKDRDTLTPPGGIADRNKVIATLQDMIAHKKSGRALAAITNYKTLEARMDYIGNITKANALLHWYGDTERKTDLDDHKSALSMLEHALTTSPLVDAGIAAVEKKNIRNAWKQRNFTLIKTNYSLLHAVPEKLVGDLSKANSACYAIWPKAKQKNDFKAMREPLRKVLDLTIQQATLWGDVYGCDAYDAQMKQWAPGNSQASVDVSFGELAQELPPLVQQIVAKQKAEGPFKNFKVNPKQVVQMNVDLAARLGFNFNRGRLDSSPHPFSSGTKYDTRMTTAYHEEVGVMDSLYSTIHETGHSNYQQNVPARWENQPLGLLSDMTIHESQSMILERSVGGHEGFLEFMYGFIGQYDPEFSKQGTVAEFIRSFRKVTPSLIRIEADAVTYALHPMFRYEIEKMLFKKEAKVDDIPELWNAAVKKNLDLDVPSDKEGCLQDVHWYCGYYGYFETYGQGTLNQAQLFETAKKDITGLDEQLRQGNVAELNAWSQDKIHRWGKFLDAADLMKQATGSFPTAKPFLDQTRQRYLG